MEKDIFNVITPDMLVGITDGPSEQEILEKNLKRTGLFAKGSSVFLLDSIEKQSGTKIAALTRRIANIAQSELEFAQDFSGIVPIGWNSKAYVPKINVYVKCGDEKLSDKSQKMLSVLYREILTKGIRIELHALNANDKFACAVNDMINSYQAAQIKKEFIATNQGKIK